MTEPNGGESFLATANTASTAKIEDSEISVPSAPMTALTTSIPTCPECGSSGPFFKDGTRTLRDNSQVQRFLCRDCGHRFSGVHNNSNSVRDNTELSHLCAKKGAKKMADATEIQTVAGKEIQPLPPQAKGLIAKYMAYLEREGYYKDTSYLDLISVIARDGADLLDPEDVKTKIAKHKWKSSVKMLATYAYDAFCRMENIQWTPPTYRQEETVIEAPDEKDLNQLINATQSRRLAAFLQCLKETFADPGEILRLEWQNVKDNVITIQHPVKGHLPGKMEVSSTLLAMINALPRTSKLIFPMNYKAMSSSFRAMRKKAAIRLQNPRLLSITSKSFRHWGGSMLAVYTNGNVLTIKKMLRHKNIQNTMKYIHNTPLKDIDYEIATATNDEEIKKLGNTGFRQI